LILFWGIVGILNGIFLPGAMVTVLASPRLNVSRFLSISLVLSLIINYIICLTLIIPGFYTKHVMISLFIFYLFIIISSYFIKSANISAKTSISKNYNIDNSISLSVCIEEKNLKIIYYICFFIAFIFIFLFYHKILFKGVDPIVNWNAWAVSWANNTYPKTMGDYPQLMPIIMGIPYLFMGQEIPQVFSILSLELITLISILCFYTLKSSNYSYGSAVAALGTVWLFIVTGVGYADVIVGILALMAFSIFQWHLAELKEQRHDSFFLYAAFSAAAASATIKQSGLFWWPFFILIVIEGYKLNNYKYLEIIEKIIIPVILSLLIIFPWYIYNRYLIYLGKNNSMTNYFLNATGLFHGHSFFSRSIYSIFKYFYYTIFALPAIWGLKRPGYRALSLSCLFIMFSWALFFSYGPGNVKFPVMLAFFPLGLFMKSAITQKSHIFLWTCLSRRISIIKTSILTWPRLYLVSFLVCLLAICFFFSSKIDSNLINFHKNEALKLGKVGLTRRVDYLEKLNPQKIVSFQAQLKQVMSIPKGYYTYSVPPKNFLDYGYLVINDNILQIIDTELLYDNYYEDYKEDEFHLYVRKNLNIFNLPCLNNP
jgi:hypothetical protein